jgi:hypothetical protein
MAISAEQTSELLTEAALLRPQRLGADGTLLEVAHALGVQVWLKGVPSEPKSHDGFLEYTSPARITVYRQSSTSFSRALSSDDIDLLDARGRFTLAHELGHWLAYARFGVTPATARSEYWKDEEAVNRIAAHLLIPNWQLDSWFSGLSDCQGVHVQLLCKWARELGLSRQAVSSRICEQRKGTGFLMLRVKNRPSVHFPDIVVEHSASDTDLFLPQRSQIIRSERLVEKLASASTNAGTLPGLSFDKARRKAMTYHLSWMRSRASANLPNRHKDSFTNQMAETYWTSWALTGFGRCDEGLSDSGLF